MARVSTIHFASVPCAVDGYDMVLVVNFVQATSAVRTGL